MYVMAVVVVVVVVVVVIAVIAVVAARPEVSVHSAPHRCHRLEPGLDTRVSPPSNSFHIAVSVFCMLITTLSFAWISSKHS